MDTTTARPEPPGTTAVPLLHDIPEVAATTRLARSTVYREMKAGRLRSVKVGARRLIPHEALLDWLATLQGGDR